MGRAEGEESDGGETGVAGGGGVRGGEGVAMSSELAGGVLGS